jgi:RNA polymerase sigma-70 factor (ECF subfamily)
MGQTGAADAEPGPHDARLIAAVAKGDARAFRVLVERHGRTLHRIAYRMLGDASEAEDVAQESLLRLWDNAAAWRPVGGGVPGWLRRVATNLCLDRIRKTARLTDAPVPECADETPAADAVLDARRLAEVARAAVLALPDRQRAAIVLTYYEQANNAEAADALGLKVKAFESLLVRARAALRENVGAAGISGADLATSEGGAA